MGPSSRRCIFLLTLVFLQNVCSYPQGERHAIPVATEETKGEVTTSSSDHEAGTNPSEMETIQNDSLICFPYFVSQDVDALLAQATRLLHKSVDHRQMSWLQLFVNRLDALSRLLRSIPTETKNMCFHHYQHDEVDVSQEDSEEEEEMEEEISESLKSRASPQQYVTGTIYERQQRSGIVPVRIRTRSDPNLGKEFSMGTFMGRGPLIPDAFVQRSMQNALMESRPEYPVPISEQVSFSEENVPFLPRSTRKNIPWQILERLQYKKQANHKQASEDSSASQLVQRHDSLSKMVEEKPSTANSNNPEEIPDSSTQAALNTNSGIPNPHENRQRDIDQQTTNPLKSLTKSASNNDVKEDEVVLQLHADLKITPKVEAVTEIGVIKDASSTKAQKKFEATEGSNELTHESEKNVATKSKVWAPKTEGNNKPIDDASLYLMPSLNNLDFDYEEQGAAIGELYTEDDPSQSRNIAVPLKVDHVGRIDGVLLPPTRHAEDDPVLQLNALKSPTSTEQLRDTKLPPIAGPTGRVHRSSNAFIVDDKK